MDRLSTVWRRSLAFLKTNHLARNSGFTIATAAANGILGFAFWTVADRWAPPSSIGAATALLSVVILASIIANFGIGPTIVQRLPQLKQPREWASMVSAAVIASGAIASIIGIFLLLIVPHIAPVYNVVLHRPILAVTLVFGVVFLTCATMLDYVNMGARETHVGFIRNVIFGLLKLGLLVALVLVGVEESTTSLLSVWIWSSAIISLLTFAYLLPLTGHENHWPTRETWAELGQGAVRIVWNYLAMLGGAVIPYLMPLVVITVLSPTQNAYFYMAWTIANLLLVVSAAVSGNMLAEASFTSGHLRAQVISGMRIVCSILVPASIVILLFGKTILSAFGSAYASKFLHDPARIHSDCVAGYSDEHLCHCSPSMGEKGTGSAPQYHHGGGLVGPCDTAHAQVRRLGCGVGLVPRRDDRNHPGRAPPAVPEKQTHSDRCGLAARPLKASTPLHRQSMESPTEPPRRVGSR